MSTAITLYLWLDANGSLRVTDRNAAPFAGPGIGYAEEFIGSRQFLVDLPTRQPSTVGEHGDEETHVGGGP